MTRPVPVLPVLPALLLAAGAVAAAACTGEITGGPFTDLPPSPRNPYEELERLQREGPPRYSSRVHGCTKLRYRTLGNVLRSRGVALAATGEVSAGRIYREGSAALGAPSYAGRVRETLELGLATTSKLYDIFAQAAPELIASMSARPECGGAPLFDTASRCNPDGVSCLIGVPATPTHLQICDQTVARAADVESGKRLAVAVLAAAAHTCE
jgi:hypothetical protein